MNFSRDNLSIPDDKIIGYLLNPVHPVGKFKAKLYLGKGFNSNGEDLREALYSHASANKAVEVDSEYGRRFKVEANCICPDGSVILLRSIWMIDDGKDFARLLTAYPV